MVPGLDNGTYCTTDDGEFVPALVCFHNAVLFVQWAGNILAAAQYSDPDKNN